MFLITLLGVLALIGGIVFFIMGRMPDTIYYQSDDENAPGYTHKAYQVGAIHTKGVPTIINNFTASVLMGVGLIIILLNTSLNPFAINDAGERTVIQPIKGDLWVQFDPGLYFAGFFSKQTVWPNNFTIQVSREENRSNEADLWVISHLKDGTFSEGDNAELEHTVKWDLPSNKDRMLELHITYNNVNNLMETTLLSYQKKIASFSTQRLSSEAHYSGGKSQLDEYFQDQLRHGQVLLITETKTRTLADSTTKTYIDVSPKTTPDGQVMRTKSDIQTFGILSTYTSMDNVHYDERIYEKLKAKIDAASEEATSKQELITAQQVALTEKAKGEQLIAKTEAREQSAKREAVIRAEKEAEVAEENLKRDKFTAASTLALKRAEAEGDRLKVQAGLSPLERAKIDQATAIGVAAEIAKVKFPDDMIIVGAGDGKGGGVNPFEAVGLESFYNLSKKMSSSK